MKWTPDGIIETLLGVAITGMFGVIAKAFGWLRFRKKDKAEVGKVEAEIAVDLAHVNNKKIDDEVKISKAALEWAVQLASQLEKTNIIVEKKQMEVDSLRHLMNSMREEFDKKMEQLEALLNITQKELVIERVKNNEEKEKNTKLLERLKSYLDKGDWPDGK